MGQGSRVLVTGELPSEEKADPGYILDLIVTLPDDRMIEFFDQFTDWVLSVPEVGRVFFEILSSKVMIETVNRR